MISLWNTIKQKDNCILFRVHHLLLSNTQSHQHRQFHGLKSLSSKTIHSSLINFYFRFLFLLSSLCFFLKFLYFKVSIIFLNGTCYNICYKLCNLSSKNLRNMYSAYILCFLKIRAIGITLKI